MLVGMNGFDTHYFSFNIVRVWLTSIRLGLLIFSCLFERSVFVTCSTDYTLIVWLFQVSIVWVWRAHWSDDPRLILPRSTAGVRVLLDPRAELAPVS